MIELVYMSQAQHIFGEDELNALLEQARRNNTRRGITGMLMYDGHGTFIQAIEGEKEQIEELFEIIKGDPRHGDIQELGTTPITQRNFPEWKMAFKRLNEQDLSSLDGYSDFMESSNSNDMDTNNSFAIEMLNHFRHSTGQ